MLSETQAAALSAELSERFHLTAEAVCGFVAERFGLAYTPHAVLSANAASGSLAKPVSL